MPWTEANFNRDTDNPSIGTASASHDAGFTFTRRVDEKNNLRSFIADAQAALAEHQKQTSEVDAIETKILSALNG